MSRLITALIALAALCAYSPEPRSTHYVKAYPEEIDRALSRCTAGSLRGAECNNADLAKAHRAADARSALFKSAFRGR